MTKDEAAGVLPSDQLATDDWLRSVVRALLAFGLLFSLQLGHLIEHILLVLSGKPFFGQAAQSQMWHFSFNTTIGVVAVIVLLVYRRNPWVYPLVLITSMHGIEDAYRYVQFVIGTGQLDGLLSLADPQLFGIGGRIGLIPLEPTDLHNLWNGLEWILITLGFAHEVEATLAPEPAPQNL